ncbi:MAG: 3'-5' exonuclease [Flammeovirgaceae bacterium]
MEKTFFQKQLKNLLFIDIETIAGQENFKLLSPEMQHEWEKKSQYFRQNEDSTPENIYFQKAGIYAEFGKIITIGIGYFHQDDTGEITFRSKVLQHDEEKELLLMFKEIIEKKFNPKTIILVAHNGKEFDFPYICRRMIIHQISLPIPLKLSGKKTWQVEHLDTMEMWRFGDEKRYTSLKLLANIFGFSNTKQEIDGSMVNEIFYKEKDIPKIMRYCLEDVILTAKVFLRIMQLPDLKEENYIRL